MFLRPTYHKPLLRRAAGSRLRLAIARRNLFSVIHAVSYRRSANCRCNNKAGTPGLSVVIKWAAQNQTFKDVFVLFRIVPGGERDLVPTPRALPAPQVNQLVCAPFPQRGTRNRPASGTLPSTVGKPLGSKLRLEFAQSPRKGRPWHGSTLLLYSAERTG
jgi:hypothetical protein